MAYFQPYIDDSGIHIPTYNDIVEHLVTEAQSIFGADVYLENDSQDYQWISITAKAISDAMNALVIEYNQRSPRTAIGAALSGLVRINGINRNPATFSECIVKIAGTSGTVINNGIVRDVSGVQWYLPPIVTIPALGYIFATAVCEVAGAKTALIGDITQIVTPTFGWDSVTNEQAADPGAEIETDAALRARQKVSTALPSRTILEGTLAAILDLQGVTRARVYENDTNTTNALGHPAHSITPVVEGGVAEDIANAIFYKKNPGCYTNGAEAIDVTDENGTVITIRYTIPTDVDIDATITIKMLTGYSSGYADDIKAAIVEYLDGLNIGETVYNSSLWQASLSAANSISNPAFAVTGVVAAVHGGTQTTSDITIGYDEVSRGNVANLVVVET